MLDVPAPARGLREHGHYEYQMFGSSAGADDCYKPVNQGMSTAPLAIQGGAGATVPTPEQHQGPLYANPPPATVVHETATVNYVIPQHACGAGVYDSELALLLQAGAGAGAGTAPPPLDRCLKQSRLMAQYGTPGAAAAEPLYDSELLQHGAGAGAGAAPPALDRCLKQSHLEARYGPTGAAADPGSLASNTKAENSLSKRVCG